MTTIKGTPVAVNAVAAIRDKDAGCPQPYSQARGRGRAPMTRLAIAALALASACTPPPCETCARAPSARRAVDLCVDAAFAPAERAAIARAAARWTDALCGEVIVDVRVADDCSRAIVRVHSSAVWVTMRAPCPPHACVAAWTNAARDTAYVIVDRVPVGALEPVVAHEIGHLLGADEGNGLMSVRLRDACIDRRAAVQAAHGVSR